MPSKHATNYEALLAPLIDKSVSIRTTWGSTVASGVLCQTQYGYCLQSVIYDFNRLHLQTPQILSIYGNAITLRQSERVAEECYFFAMIG